MDQPTAGTTAKELVPGVRIAPGALHFSFSRAGGPGGQNVNKLNTKAELRLKLGDLEGLSGAARLRLAHALRQRITRAGELIIVAEAERTQNANRTACLEKLRHWLRLAMVAPTPRRPTAPTRASRAKRLDAKRARGQLKARRRRPEME